MITYFITICIVLSFAYLAQNSIKITDGATNNISKTKNTGNTIFFLFVVVFTLTFVSGFRYYVGADSEAYTVIFKRNNHIFFKGNYNITEEPAFVLLCRICGKIYNNYITMFIATSIITIIPFLVSTYRESNDYIFVTALYIFCGCWHGSFNGIRQYIAVTIVYLGRHYIIKHKFLKYLLFCLIAFLFHRSAAFAILFYFVYSEEFSFKRISFIIIITIILSLSYESIYSFIGWLDNEEFVLNDYSMRSVNTLRVLVQCCPAVLAIYLSLNKKIGKNQVFYVYMLLINAAIYIAMSNSAYLTRLGIYTSAFIPLGLNCILDEKISIKYYKVIRFVVTVFYFLFWLYGIYSTGSLNNFRFIFNK